MLDRWKTVILTLNELDPVRRTDLICELAQELINERIELGAGGLTFYDAQLSVLKLLEAFLKRNQQRKPEPWVCR